IRDATVTGVQTCALPISTQRQPRSTVFWTAHGRIAPTTRNTQAPPAPPHPLRIDIFSTVGAWEHQSQSWQMLCRVTIAHPLQARSELNLGREGLRRKLGHVQQLPKE